MTMKHTMVKEMPLVDPYTSRSHLSPHITITQAPLQSFMFYLSAGVGGESQGMEGIGRGEEQAFE